MRGTAALGVKVTVSKRVNFFLFIISLIFALVLAEGAVRVLGIAPEVAAVSRYQFRLSPNQLIGYEPIPNVGYSNETLERKGKVNAYGYRDFWHAKKKPPGVKRVVVIGDSITAGLNIPTFSSTLPSYLQNFLDSSGVTAEVINFGVSGYNTQQEVETLRVRGTAYAPDVVILQYCLNDRELVAGDIVESLASRVRSSAAIDPAHISAALSKSALFRLIFGLHYQFRGRDTRAHDLIESLSRDTVEQSFYRLRDLSVQHRFDVLVAIFPQFGELENYSKAGEHQVIGRLAHELGFHTVDLLETFKECAKKDQRAVAFDIYHPTALGHWCAAREIAKATLPLLKIKPRPAPGH